MAKYQSPIVDTPDEHMRLVGIIALHWEWVEIVLERVLADVMEQDFSSIALLTNNVSFRDKCDLILTYARVFEEPEPETWKRFTKSITRLKDAYSGRNQFIHAQWRRDKTTKEWGRSVVRTRGGKLTLLEETVLIGDMEKVAQEIWDAAEEFTQLCQARGVLLFPWNDKS